MARYINPFTDLGSKKLFGEEANKDLLIDFLHQLLPAKHRVLDLICKRTGNLGTAESDRRAVFDIYCESETGWSFELKAVYCIAILDFVLDDRSDNPKFAHTVQLRNDDCRMFYDKLTFIFLEIPKLNQSEMAVFLEKLGKVQRHSCPATQSHLRESICQCRNRTLQSDAGA